LWEYYKEIHPEVLIAVDSLILQYTMNLIAIGTKNSRSIHFGAHGTLSPFDWDHKITNQKALMPS